MLDEGRKDEVNAIYAFRLYPHALLLMRPVIVMMVKAPRAGLVKTRLVPQVSAVEAAELSACFALDVLACALRVAPWVIVAYAPPDGRAALEALLPAAGRLFWHEQRGADLGARLDGAIRHAFDAGFAPVLVVGADSPTLPPEFIEKARDALAVGQADIALGPTADGGYYLIGLREPVPNLFQNVDWSTPRVFEQTARNAARAGLRLQTLPLWYDVDTLADLQRLRGEIIADGEAQARAPATTRWLLKHDLPSA